jgi:1-acyl-sn-glycerol-3-phosphate acyltransferase
MKDAPSRQSFVARYVVPVTYRLATAFARVAVRIYFPRLAVSGLEHVPRQGPVIIAPNHLNNLDPCLLFAILPRRGVFLAHRGLFDVAPSALLMTLVGAVPVRNEGIDIEALRGARQALARGLAVVAFPEGERSRTGALVEGQAGAALLALRGSVPIVPVAISGTGPVGWPWVFARPFLGPRISVHFGEPFTLAGGDERGARAARAGIDVIMRRIAALLPPERRGAYGDAGAPSI